MDAFIKHKNKRELGREKWDTEEPEDEQNRELGNQERRKSVELGLGLSEVVGSDVFQKPDIIWSSPGSSAEMNCTHNKGVSYSRMYWYKQLPGQGFTLIAFTTVGAKPDYGTFSEDKYQAVKTVAESGSFTVKNLQQQDDALYLCSLFCEDVHQSPADVLCLPEESVNLTCKHSIQNYNIIQWYQKIHGDTSLHLIGYVYYTTTKQIEKDYEGLLFSKDVHQSPADVLCLPEAPVTLTCNHSINSYNTILWYQKLHHEDNSLKLIGYVYFTKPEYEKHYEGQVDGSGVFQKPEIIWGSPGSSVEMNCSHNKDINHRQMYWFKQLPGKGLTLLVFTSVGVEPDYGEFSNKYQAVKTVVESGTLTVKNLEAGDAALYFCAVKQHCGAKSL
ncbi:T-cell receptor beta chain V region LB2 [Bagarius yarrelli]|nr:T-cell receptor beta chain V region LB2 [Bagarius yarrelli]